MLPLLPTSLVGSYPQPEWLIDRDRLVGRLPPRVRATELWRGAQGHLAVGQGDAPGVASRGQGVAGVDHVSGGGGRPGG